MKKLINLTALAVMTTLMILFSGCEKELPTSSTLSEEEMQQSVVEGIAITGIIDLSEIQYELKDNRLSFESAYEFRKALNAVSNATTEDVLVWLNQTGFQSHYATYNDAMTRLEENPNTKMDNLLTGFEKNNLLFGADIPLSYNSPSLIYAYLTNDAGELLIDNDLNVFRKDVHILVDEANPELYSEVLQSMESNEAAGVLVTAIESREMIMEDQEKSADKFFNSCPVSAPSSLAHQIVRKTNGTKRKMVCTLSQLNVAITITAKRTGNQYDYEFLTQIDIHNTRKSGFHWIRTFPDFTVINGTGASDRDVDVSRLVLNINTSNNYVIHLHNYLGIATNGHIFDQSFGIADKTILIDDKQLTVDWSVLNCTTCAHLTSAYSITDGRVNVKWDNHDTGMEINLGCP